MNAVIHVRTEYLPISETFIYDQIKNIKQFKSIVLTQQTENIALFPHDSIYILKKNIFGSYNIMPFEKYLSKNLFDRISLRISSKRQFAFDKFVDDNDICLLHAHFGPEGIFSLLLKRIRNLPLVTSFYGWDASMLLTQNPLIYKDLFEKGDLFLAISNYIKDRLISVGCPKEKVIVQRLGIDLTKFVFKERTPSDRLNLLFVGRLVEKKGVEYLIKAMAKIIEKYPNVTLKIIGEGPELGKIEGIKRSLNLNKFVSIEGEKTHETVIKEMLDSHILILPSITASDGDTEGQGAVLLEAQATGMPVVSTWHNGIPEGVLHDKTGQLAKTKDSDDLAEKIIYLLDNPELWPEYGRSGRNLIENNFNLELQLEKLEKIYEKLI